VVFYIGATTSHPEENQYEAGLNFAISFNKKTNFIGKESLLKIKDKKVDRRFIMLSLIDNNPGYPLLLQEEPIYLNDKIIGRTTSGNYSFNYNKNLSFGYVKSEYSNEELMKMELYIEVAKQKYQAKVEVNPLKDKQARFL
tara:strand:- start:502 stop:924 length:423 start_codon:yes stop_codon:yes gene_type:complete